MMSRTPKSTKYHTFIRGLLVELRSGQKSAVKKMIVTPAFIELWYMVTENAWDDTLWRRLSQTEKNYMVELAQKTGAGNKQLQLAQNAEAHSLVNRLELLEGGLSTGNDSPELLKEFYEILDQLGNRQMLSRLTISTIKKKFDRVLGHVEGTQAQTEKLKALAVLEERSKRALPDLVQGRRAST